MNPSSSPSYGRPCLLHQAGGPVRSFTRLSLPVLCIVGFSTIAQEPLVLEPQSGSHSTARSSSPFASFSTDVAPTPNEHSAPDATPHAAAPATAPGGRPNFLPPPAPHRANPAQEQQQPAGTPDTIITQVEVPIPPQTAEPLAIGIPSASRAGGPVGDAAFLRETSPAPTPRQATLAPSASAPPSTYAAPPAPSAQTVAAANRREEAVLPREAIPSTIDESGGDASVPTVVYDKGQQALPQPAIPAAPAPPPPPDFGQLLKQRRYSEIEPVAIDTADSKLASALGWSRYQDGRTDLAYSWFERAMP